MEMRADREGIGDAREMVWDFIFTRNWRKQGLIEQTGNETFKKK